MKKSRAFIDSENLWEFFGSCFWPHTNTQTDLTQVNYTDLAVIINIMVFSNKELDRVNKFRKIDRSIDR